MIWDILQKIFLNKEQRELSRYLEGRKVKVTRNGRGFYEEKN